MSVQQPMISGFEISQQRSFVPHQMSPPDPESLLYVDKFTQGVREGCFAYQGVRLVLDGKEQVQGIWRELMDGSEGRGESGARDGKTDSHRVKFLYLVCDELVVRDRLHLPRASVVIAARVIRFEGDDACIDTSPLPWAGPKIYDGNTRDGADGLSAGNISVAVSDIRINGVPVGESATREVQPPRFIARGGRGQDPARGRDGSPGSSLTSLGKRVHFTREGFFTGTHTETVDFDREAIFVTYKWIVPPITDPETLTKGDSENRSNWPTEGTDAVPAGVPGDGGDGGLLTTNFSGALGLFAGEGGAPGTPDRKVYRGGAAGKPKECGRYSVFFTKTMWDWWRSISEDDYRIIKDKPDAQAPDKPLRPGKNKSPSVGGMANFWVTPNLLAKALGFIADLYVTGKRDEVEELLNVYGQALKLPVPRNGSWESEEGLLADTLWQSYRQEVSTLLFRLRMGMDVIGQPAGFMPFYSLSAHMELYEQTVDRAVYLLVFANWVRTRGEAVAREREVLGRGLEYLDEDYRLTLRDIDAVNEKAFKLRERLNELKQRIGNVKESLQGVEKRLLDKAEHNTAIRSVISASVDIAATIASVVPVGQPFLGAAVSLGAAGAKLMVGQTNLYEAMEESVGVITDTGLDWLDKVSKAGKAAKALNDVGGDTPDEGAEKKGRLEKLIDAGGEVSKVVDKSGEIMSKYAVSQDVLDQELDRLRQQDPDWVEFSDTLRELNDFKRKLFEELKGFAQHQGEAFARLEQNAALRVAAEREDAVAAAGVNPVLLGYVDTLEKQCVRDLRYYLYMLMKAYECTVFDPIKGELFDLSDWNMVALVKRVGELMEEAPSAEELLSDEWRKPIRGVFDETVGKLRRKLREDFPNIQPGESQIKLVIDSERHPRLLQRLQENVGTQRGVRVDPRRHGALFYHHHLARVRDVQMTHIEFEETPKGVEWDGVTMEFRLTADETATVRKDGQLYAVNFQAGTPRPDWTANVSLSRGDSPSITNSRRGTARREMLRFVFENPDSEHSTKVAAPPLCTDLFLSVSSTPPRDRIPPIRKMEFAITYESLQRQGDPQYVLDVRPEDPEQRGVILECSVGDMASRKHGVDEMVRIFDGRKIVQLTAHDREGGGHGFQHWLDNGEVRPERSITVSLDRDKVISYVMTGAQIGV